MEIDIIDYTPEQYAVLSTRELEEIRSAQRKKNALLKGLEKNLLVEKQKLMDGGAFLSNIWEKRENQLRAACQAEIEIVRESLLFFLHYSGNEYDYDAGGTRPSVAYPVDYSLSQTERMASVRDYYLGAYADPAARFNAYAEDAFAKSYLGEGYAALWHYFQELQ